MKLAEIQQLLKAEVIAGQHLLEREAYLVCGADLMSDVLAFSKEKTLLLTGLTNIQVIRTAEVSDLVAIVFVRAKRPNNEVIAVAIEKDIPLMICRMPMYEACGTLYQHGIRGCSEGIDNGE